VITKIVEDIRVMSRRKRKKRQKQKKLHPTKESKVFFKKETRDKKNKELLKKNQ